MEIPYHLIQITQKLNIDRKRIQDLWTQYKLEYYIFDFLCPDVIEPLMSFLSCKDFVRLQVTCQVANLNGTRLWIQYFVARYGNCEHLHMYKPIQIKKEIATLQMKKKLWKGENYEKFYEVIHIEGIIDRLQLDIRENPVSMSPLPQTLQLIRCNKAQIKSELAQKETLMSNLQFINSKYKWLQERPNRISSIPETYFDLCNSWCGYSDDY